jgi:hypothetical protein
MFLYWVSAVGDLVLPDEKVDLNTISREQVKKIKK